LLADRRRRGTQLCPPRAGCLSKRQGVPAAIDEGERLPVGVADDKHGTVSSTDAGAETKGKTMNREAELKQKLLGCRSELTWTQRSHWYVCLMRRRRPRRTRSRDRSHRLDHPGVVAKLLGWTPTKPSGATGSESEAA